MRFVFFNTYVDTFNTSPHGRVGVLFSDIKTFEQVRDGGNNVLADRTLVTMYDMPATTYYAADPIQKFEELLCDDEDTSNE